MGIIENLTENISEVNLEQVKEHIKDRKVQMGLIVGIGATYIIYKQLTKKRYNMPPGPIPLPLVGNLLATGTSGLHLKYMEYGKKYGPVFTVYIGPKPVVILNSLDAMREAFITKGVDFAGRPKMKTGDYFSDNGKDIAMGQYGPVWKLQRKIAHAALRKYAAGDKMANMLKTSFEMVSAKMEQETMPIDVKDWNMLYIYNVFASLCFGRMLELEDPFFVKLQTEIKRVGDIPSSAALIDFFPILDSKFIEIGAVKFLKKLAKDMIELFDKEFEQHLHSYKPDNLSDFMYDLIHLWKEAEKEESSNEALNQLTKMHFLQIMLNIFFAGTDSTRITLSAFMLYITKYPDVQKKIHQEIDTVIGKECDITIKAKDDLHYTHAVMNEVMRIMPVAPQGFPHETTCDTTLGKYEIPKGTMVIANAWAVLYDRTICPEPETFNPDRWLNEDGKFNPQAQPSVLFSMGPRVCVGESFVKVELLLTLAMFCQKYRFEAPEGEELSLEPKDFMGALEPKPFKINMIRRV